MLKFTTALLFGLLILSVPYVNAKESIGNVSDFNTKYEHEYTDDNDLNEKLDENSFYISDEQVQDMNNTDSDINAIDDKTTFDQKVIDSGHFSSNTATRTWIPLNKVK